MVENKNGLTTDKILIFSFFAHREVLSEYLRSDFSEYSTRNFKSRRIERATKSLYKYEAMAGFEDTTPWSSGWTPSIYPIQTSTLVVITRVYTNVFFVTTENVSA
ncbi:hypothetical protein V9T40_012966 [Parthenolecanium corni]|uniref:Uncharacterized protein n=1 Tax=Parthenolecanium corni TaxID=536013 RepID=A0AAN9T8P4_9HEMI